MALAIAIIAIPFLVIEASWLSMTMLFFAVHTILLTAVQLWYTPNKSTETYSTTTIYNFLVVHFIVAIFIDLAMIGAFTNIYERLTEIDDSASALRFLWLLVLLPTTFFLAFIHRQPEEQLRKIDQQFLFNPWWIMAIPLFAVIMFYLFFLGSL